MHFPLRFTGVAGTTLISLVENCNGRVGSTFTRAGTSRVDTFSCIYVTEGRTGEIKIFSRLRLRTDRQRGALGGCRFDSLRFGHKHLYGARTIRKSRFALAVANSRSRLADTCVIWAISALTTK